MADADTLIDLDELHDAIRDQVAAAFPSFETVEFYRDDEDQQIPTPACLLELTEMEPVLEQNPGTEQLPVMLRFTAHVIAKDTGAESRLEIRKAAAALATWLHKKSRFDGQNTDAIQVLGCGPDEFAPEVTRFKVWAVEFGMVAFLGDTVWKNDGVIPTNVLYSWSPRIGFGNEPHYQPIADGIELP